MQFDKNKSTPATYEVPEFPNLGVIEGNVEWCNYHRQLLFFPKPEYHQMIYDIMRSEPLEGMFIDPTLGVIVKPL